MPAAQAQAGILDASRADKTVCGGRGADSLGSYLNFRNILSMVLGLEDANGVRINHKWGSNLRPKPSDLKASQRVLLCPTLLPVGSVVTTLEPYRFSHL